MAITTGLMACAVSSLLFGSFLVPIKLLRTGDGMFVQFMMGNAILCVACLVNWLCGWPKFVPLAMVGGVLWSTGNATAVPIINRIGMTLGLLIWGTSGCFFGWASGRFGWFGVHKQVPASDLLNAIGLLLAFVSAVMFAFVKTEVHREPSQLRLPSEDVDGRALLDESQSSTEDLPSTSPSAEAAGGGGRSVGAWCGRNASKLYGVGLSVVAGVFYGLCFAPVIYTQDTDPTASKDGLHYVFSHLLGSWLACTLYFVVYCVLRRNRPHVEPGLALPSFVAGLMWALAQTGWFVANDNLSEAVSFPILTRMPGVVAAAWGVFYFKEIRGSRNLTILSLAVIVTIVGGVLSGLSKVVKLSET